jgi:hypothetical protein
MCIASPTTKKKEENDTRCKCIIAQKRVMKRQQVHLYPEQEHPTRGPQGQEKMLCTGDAKARGEQMP